MKTEEDQKQAWAKTQADISAIRARFVRCKEVWTRRGKWEEWRGWYFGIMSKARSFEGEEHQKPFWDWYEKEGEDILVKAEEEEKLHKEKEMKAVEDGEKGRSWYRGKGMRG